MSEDIEDRFRQACSNYLAAVEQYERESGAEALAATRAEFARLAADEARDQLVQVVRERDVQAQLVDAEGRIHPSDRAAAARDKWLAAVRDVAGTVTWMTPMAGSQRWHDMVAAGICPECGVSWGLQSPDCPKVHFNRHILG